VTQETPLIDGHHHLWKLGHGNYPWLEHAPIKPFFGDYSAIRRDYLIDDLLEDARGTGLVKSVHVQAEWDERDPVAETRWLQGVADAHGFPHGIVGYANLTDPRVEATLDAHLRFANMRGIRMMLRRPDTLAANVANPAALLEDAQFLRGFALLAPRRLSFDLQAPATVMPAAARLAEAFPETRIILIHMGHPALSGPAGIEGWRTGIAQLARQPNVSVKISGFGVADRALRPEVLRPLVHGLLDAFGPERCLFATNFPVDKLMGGYAQMVDLARMFVREWNPEAEQAVMHDTAARIYRL
jgi:predicted TIM-barrel fold metal-dependent hydrolase